MELLYFIGGILSVGIVYGIRLLSTVKSSHTDLLARYQSQSNISSIREVEFKQDLQDLHILVNDIQSNMEKDQYAAVSEINKKLTELDKSLNDTLERLNFTNQSNDKNFKTTFNEIQQLKNRLKALGQDPNFLSRY